MTVKPLFLTLSLALSANLHAELVPTQFQPDAVATEANFSASELGESWSVAKGVWNVVDGTLRGSELPSDQHAAVLTLKHPHVDSAIRFRFQLAGSNGFSLSYNHPKGHLFRVNVNERKIQIMIDKDKKDPTSKAELVTETAVQIEQGEWHELICETQGDQVSVQLGEGVKLQGSHAALPKPKTGYRFVLRGEGAAFDDVLVWDSKK